MLKSKLRSLHMMWRGMVWSLLLITESLVRVGVLMMRGWLWLPSVMLRRWWHMMHLLKLWEPKSSSLRLGFGFNWADINHDPLIKFIKIFNIFILSNNKFITFVRWNFSF